MNSAAYLLGHLYTVRMCELSREVLLLYLIPTLAFGFSEPSGTLISMMSGAAKTRAFFGIPGIDHKKAHWPILLHQCPVPVDRLRAGGGRAGILPICIYG